MLVDFALASLPNPMKLLPKIFPNSPTIIFIFSCVQIKDFDEANNDENEVYLEENNTGVVTYSEKSKADPYKPDEKVFNKLHHYLLQDFIPQDENISNESEEEEEDKPQEKVKARKKKSKAIRKKQRW